MRQVGTREQGVDTMAVGLIFDGAGVTQAQYEQVLQKVSPDNRLAPGMLTHSAGTTENGWCVVETWESQEAAGQFFQQKLGQALEQAGINIQPKFFQVVNTMR
jgi:quinol monooxygenase YgiN